MPSLRPDEQLLLLLNRRRASAGLPLLRPNAALHRAAQRWAQLLAATGEFGHTGPDGSTPASRIAAAGYEGSVVGEILARDFATPAEVMASWMSSALHRANLLDADFTEVGVGLAARPGGAVWVLDFGGGAAAPAPPRIERGTSRGRFVRPAASTRRR